MSKIDTLIKELQEKKKKIDYLDYIIDLVSNDQKCIDFIEVQEEVISKLTPLLSDLKKQIEDGILDPSESSNQLSSDELNTLKVLANKVKSKMSQPETSNKSKNSPYSSESEDDVRPDSGKSSIMSNQDKLNFAINNRHLANKKVNVRDGTKNIEGVVVGLDAPDVIVRTEAGPCIKVPVNRIELGV